MGWWRDLRFEEDVLGELESAELAILAVGGDVVQHHLLYLPPISITQMMHPVTPATPTFVGLPLLVGIVSILMYLERWG